MLTLPDQPDAVAECPPFSPVGPIPAGFFADCQPSAGYAGTRVLAEHLNELILNLRALLVRGHVTAVKGDPTMLYRAIEQLLIVQQPVTLHVSLTGSPTPFDPVAGDPFDSIASCLTWLARYRITATASVKIRVAAGTYPTASFSVTHPDGARIEILGAGAATTRLDFPADARGIIIENGLGRLADLTLRGQGAATAGAWDAAGLALRRCDLGELRDVVLERFSGAGLTLAGGAVQLKGTVTVRDNRNLGVLLNAAAFVNVSNYELSTILRLTNNAGVTNLMLESGEVRLGLLETLGGTRALVATGNQSLAVIRRLNAGAATDPAAVQVTNGGMLLTAASSVAGDWWTWNQGTNAPQNFFASTYGYLAAGPNVMIAANRANCSPAVNTLGNWQASILA